MATLYVVLAILLGVVCAATVAADLTRQPRVVATLQRLGVDHLLPLLATLKALGGVGLLVGIAVRPIGVLAAAGLTLYFAVATAAHLRARDSVSEATPPVVLGLTSALCLVAGVGS